MRLLILLAAAAAVVHGTSFLEDGKEYIYEELGSQVAGTMDYAPSAAGYSYKVRTRMQVHGRVINVQFENMQDSQYNGPYQPGVFDWQTVSSNVIPQTWDPISIVYQDGRIVSIDIPASFNPTQKNFAKAWASNWQIALNEEETRHSFTSMEPLIHGDCQIHYTRNDHLVTRSVSHLADCQNRKYRHIDNFGGQRCDRDGRMEAHTVNGEFQHGRKSPEPIFSNTDTFFDVVKVGNKYRVNRMSTSMGVNVQIFETEGVSNFVHFNRTMILVEEKASTGDIVVSGTETHDHLSMDFADSHYSWNDNIDPNAREAFYTGDAGTNFNQQQLIDGAKAVLEGIYANFDKHDSSPETIEKMHQFGLNAIMRHLVYMDFTGLMQLFGDLRTGASTKKGVTLRNLFTEFIGSMGTRPAAMAIKSGIEQSMFDNDRDAARALTSIAFYIRRPNQALYNQFSSINIPREYKWTLVALPMARAHLARRTCELAGEVHAQEYVDCIAEIVDPLADAAYSRLIQGTYEEKMLVLSEMANLKIGKVASIMKPIFTGEVADMEDAVRARAVYVSGQSAGAFVNAHQWYLPVYLDIANAHEIRIAALQMIFLNNPDATTLSTIMSSLYAEPDYEVVNFAFTIFEKYANSINPCTRKQSHQDLAKYFLKYMKQAGFHGQNFGFGVSKTYSREFQKEKYGYGFAYEFYTIGSHHSTTPLAIGMSINSNMYHSYKRNHMSVHLRIEGLAKALVRRFKKIPESSWHLNDLTSILAGMGVQPKSDQPIRVEVLLAVKGAVILHRIYDESAALPGGKFTQFLAQFDGLGESYAINHQRGGILGQTIYEQPTDSGLSMGYMTLVNTMVSVDANVVKNVDGATLERSVNYKLNFATQAASSMFVHNPAKALYYGITQDRVHHIRSPRQVDIKFKLAGESPGPKIEVGISRPTFERPLAVILHSETATIIHDDNSIGLLGEGDLTTRCPARTCMHVLTKGDAYKITRPIVDRTNKFLGSYMYGEYFNCEMDISRGNTVQRLMGAFSPQNKNPKTFWTMLEMGQLQIRSFLFYFPRAEQCGAFFRWSQSQINPVAKTVIKATAKFSEKDNPIMFFRGKIVMVKVEVTSVSEDPSKNRVYKSSIEYDTTAGRLQNKITVLLSRQENPALNMEGFMICGLYKSKYPDFGDEFMTVDMSEDLKVAGSAELNYGPAGANAKCKSLPTSVQLLFQHFTTASSRADVLNTWYGRQCESDKLKSEWHQRVSMGGAPMTEACFLTNYDAARARKFMWKAKFTGLTARVKGILSKAEAVVKAGMIPYWDIDPAALSEPIANSRHLEVKVEFKDNERLLDVMVKTAHGTSEFTDIPVRLPGWTQRLRNLKFSSAIPRLIQSDIINPCVQTIGSVHTIDNTTLPYMPQSCWSLISSHCSAKPTYAVFTRQGSSGMDMEAYIGGHKIEITSEGIVTVGGSTWTLVNHQEQIHESGGREIFRMVKWGNTYNIYSFLKVWIVFDGSFVGVFPAPSVKGEHCGVCGNYDNNMKNELTGKTREVIAVDRLAEEWCK